MAKKKGICRNEECEMYGQEFIQEVDEFNFVCEKCGEPLFELPKKKSWWNLHGKQVLIVTASVAVIAVIIALCMTMCSGGKTDVSQGNGVDTDSVAKGPDTTTVVQQPEKTDGDSTEVNKGQDKMEQVSESKVKDPVKTVSEPKVRTSVESGFVNLGYGKYTGKLKNGKPEGEGRIVYIKSHRIAKYDAKERVAQPGESVSGLFHNGEITIGKHFDVDGNLIEPLNIGSAD